MSTIDKRNGKYLARVRLKGVSRSKIFRTLAEAKEWAALVEANIINKELGKAPSKLTFGDIIEKYLQEVTPLKKGAREETIRLKRILKTKLSFIFVSDLMPSHFAEWRDQRLKEVQGASVIRELSTLSGVCNYAIKEWGFLNKNPILMISKPPSNKPRTRRLSEQEILKLRFACDYEEDNKPEKVMHRVALAMLFAIETAMRAGEICGLKKSDVDLHTRLAHLADTKNGYARDVPLSLRALEILELLKDLESDTFFDITPHGLDANFRKAKAKAGIRDLHFHDTRREALTRMSRKVDVMLLAKISGHRDLRILQNTYYAPDMSGVASLLD